MKAQPILRSVRSSLIAIMAGITLNSGSTVHGQQGTWYMPTAFGVFAAKNGALDFQFPTQHGESGIYIDDAQGVITTLGPYKHFQGEGGKYSLDGTYLNEKTFNGSEGYVRDATWDGEQFIYAILMSSNQRAFVYREDKANLSYLSPWSRRFDISGLPSFGYPAIPVNQRPIAYAITYDPVNNTLWTGDWNSGRVAQWALDHISGNPPLSSFNVPGGKIGALAFDPGDETLWLVDNISEEHQQYDRQGNLLSCYPKITHLEIRGGEISAGPSNTAPTADAGTDQSIRAGDTVNLDGSGSSDDNTDTAWLTYAWTFSSPLPQGSSATLTDANTATPSFTADVAGTYDVQLIVTDQGGLESDPALVTVSSDNLAPTAKPTVDYSLAIVGTAVNFDALDPMDPSSDPEGDSLTYSWAITAAPAGSAATLVGELTATPSLTADIKGCYNVTLTVSDFIGPGTPVAIEIVATTAEDFAEIQIMDSSDAVGELVANQVTTAGNQNALGNFLAQAILEIQAGNTADAIDKLNKAIARTDGWPLRGAPDGNGPGRDWITDYDAQLAVYALLNAAVDALTAP